MKQDPKPWKTLSTKQLSVHGRYSVCEDTVRLPDGTISTYVYLDSVTDSVAVIAINSKGELLLQREYSHPPKEVMWQLPGGSMQPGEYVLDAAIRELSEESGYGSKRAESIGFFYTNNRNTKKKQYVVVCRNPYKHKQPHDHDEFITSHWLSVQKIKQMMSNNEINNINLLAALNLWFHKDNQ